MKPHMRSWTVAATTTLLLVTASCAADPIESPVAGSGTSVAASPEGALAQEDTATEFQTIELEGTLVDSFPGDVPLYDAAIVKSLAGVSEVTGKPEWAVLMTTGDSLDEVDARIRESYGSDGWTIGTDMEASGGYLIVARGNGYTVSVTYNDLTGSGITINYGVSED